MTQEIAFILIVGVDVIVGRSLWRVWRDERDRRLASEAELRQRGEAAAEHMSRNSRLHRMILDGTEPPASFDALLGIVRLTLATADLHPCG